MLLLNWNIFFVKIFILKKRYCVHYIFNGAWVNIEWRWDWLLSVDSGVSGQTVNDTQYIKGFVFELQQWKGILIVLTIISEFKLTNCENIFTLFIVMWVFNIHTTRYKINKSTPHNNNTNLVKKKAYTHIT